jgi:hypothetical protein
MVVVKAIRAYGLELMAEFGIQEGGVKDNTAAKARKQK